MARLEEVLLEDDRPTLLVAHSLGCHLVAGWAEHSGHKHRVKGALLVAPPDASRLPPQLHNWRQAHQGQGRGRLPFPSITVISSNDPYCSLAEGSRLAADWGSTLVLAGAAGHLNEAALLGDWHEGQTLLAQLQG
jgi:predicted alpha/beta hydrolase family esterase